MSQTIPSAVPCGRSLTLPRHLDTWWLTMQPSADAPVDDYLKPTWFIDSDAPPVREFAARVVGEATDPIEQAIRLYYAVRDEIRYSAYGIRLDRESFRASSVLELGFGWCVTKACLMAAVCRATNIPCRLGYANVRNHLATRKLLDAMGTDVFYYHGYNEILLEDRWVKATVAFNRQLCEKARLKPLEFDGRNDSLYHPYDLAGRRHMEYLHDYGHFTDLQYEAILQKFSEAYPNFFQFADAAPSRQQDFEKEIEAEAGSRDTS